MSGISDFFLGIEKVNISCRYIHGFVNELRKHIPLRKITKVSENEIYLEYFSISQKKFNSVANKFNVEILHRKSCGVPHCLKAYKKRLGLFAGCALCMLFMFYTSFFIWDIEVTGNERLTYDDVCSRLYLHGFHEGVRKSQVDLKKLYNEVLISDSRISWIAVNFDGTVARVEIRESAVVPQRDDLLDKANIVASRDGQIVRVDAVDGQRMVSVGEVVSKGQLLISAFVETRHSGSVLRNAKGNVYAKTTRNFQVSQPVATYRKVYTGNTKRQYSAKALGREFDFSFMSCIDYEFCDRSIKSEYINVFGVIKLPVRLTTQQYSEYKIQKEMLTPEQAKNICQSLLNKQIKEEIGNFPVLSKKITVEEKDGVVILNCEIECIENIGKHLELLV